MKRILLISLAAILLLVAGVLGYLYLSLNTLLKKAVETVGPRITKTTVILSSANLSPFSGSGRLNGFLVGNPEGFKGPFALKLGRVEINVNKETLLADTIVVNSILIRNPEILLEGTLTGNNLSKLLKNIESSTASSPSKEKKETPDSKSSSKKFIVKEVVISGTKLHLAASALGQNVEQTLPLPDIRLHNLGSGGSGISASDVTQQILTPLINEATKEGLNTLAKQGVKQLQSQGLKELNKALPGLFK
ncbi:MAG: AsmA family protein [Chthoniobacterales bacterium]